MFSRLDPDRLQRVRGSATPNLGFVVEMLCPPRLASFTSGAHPPVEECPHSTNRPFFSFAQLIDSLVEKEVSEGAVLLQGGSTEGGEGVMYMVKTGKLSVLEQRNGQQVQTSRLPPARMGSFGFLPTAVVFRRKPHPVRRATCE